MAGSFRFPGFPDVRPTGFALLLIACACLVPAVADAAASYGESQLEAILGDRPQLAAILMERPDLQDWLIEQLNNDSPKPLWDPTEPVSGRAAEHEYPSRGGTVPEGTALIRVSSTSPGWDQLAGLIFELHNLKHSERFEEIWRAAIAGEIDKSEYVYRLLQQEFTALRATKTFLEENVGDAPESAQDGDTLFGQILQTEGTLEAHLGKYEGEGLTNHFEKLYEQDVVPEMRRDEGSGQRLDDGNGEASPYAGQESRAIKSLSPQELSGLLAGDGLGLAKAAELNGYPGPKHVLELAEELQLSAVQIAATESLFAEMKAAAMAVGKKLIHAERELNLDFATGTVKPESLRSSLARIAECEAELRRVHLQAHLEQTELLSESQTAAYRMLRGYGGAADAHTHGSADHHQH